MALQYTPTAKVQHQFTVIEDSYNFSDSLYFTQAEYQAETVLTLRQKALLRYAAWRQAIAEPRPKIKRLLYLLRLREEVKQMRDRLEFLEPHIIEQEALDPDGDI